MTDGPGLNPCASCQVGCCRQYLVPVTGYDVWRICRGQHLGPEQFLVPAPQNEVRPDCFRLERDGDPYVLMLDKRGRFAIGQPCVFLLTLGGNDRCGIYADRPTVCRVYPMTILNGTVALGQRVLCPPGAWPDSEVAHPRWRTALRQIQMQSEIYYEVVARWNARVALDGPGRERSLFEYSDYLLNVYDRLAALDTALGEAALGEVQAGWGTVRARPGVSFEALLADESSPPWVHYLRIAREVVEDEFFPRVPPQPLGERWMGVRAGTPAGTAMPALAGN